MVNFAQMPPIDPATRVAKLKRLTKLQNGAKFEFKDMEALTYNIYGRYLDYTGEWCKHRWDRFGRVVERQFAEMDIDWTSDQ